jgi:3-oxoacyl-[acyl-carrier protein] reductase
MNLAEQTVLISGGAGALGSFLCGYLYEEVAHIILIDRSEIPLEEIKKRYPRISTICCDLTDGAAVTAAIDKLKEEHTVSVLINNAGLIHSLPLINLFDRERGYHDFAAWDEVVRSNLHSAFHLTACVASAMAKKRTKGVIINISSIAAQGNVGQSAYSAAKAGIEALTVTWAKELGMFKIRCACIAPGFMDTPSTHSSLNEATIDKWKKSVPLGKLGEIDELGKATRYIIESDYFNGRLLALDGGLRI